MKLKDYLEKALAEGWATGHFNVSESDQFRAITEAAKELNTIAIVGTSEGEAKHLGYFEAVALRDAFRKELGIPVFLNSDHHKSVEAAEKAVDAGYDSIHIDLSAEPYKKNISWTKEVVEYAKKKNPEISVEGELGYLRGESKIQKEKIISRPEDLTNPDTAKDFVSRTGVDRLAVAVGNIHGLSMDEPALDIERIKKDSQEYLDKIKPLKGQISSIDEDINQETQNRDDCKEQIVSIKNKLTQISQYEEKIKKLSEQFDVQAKEKKIYNILANAFKTIPILILEHAKPIVEQEANRILTKISDTGMRISLPLFKALKSSDKVVETLDIRVQDQVGERPYQMFSSGERVRLDLALRIGLSRLLMRGQWKFTTQSIMQLMWQN